MNSLTLDRPTDSEVSALVKTLKIPSVFVRSGQVKNKNRLATEAGRNMEIALNAINSAFSVLPLTRVHIMEPAVAAIGARARHVDKVILGLSAKRANLR
jgi:hypothetical protein